jgi:hypothetical protein
MAMAGKGFVLSSAMAYVGRPPPPDAGVDGGCDHQG